MPSKNDAAMPTPRESLGSSSVSLAAAVAHCRRCPALLAELAALYRRVDAEVAATGAACLGGGACCRFDLASHQLFVSTGELAVLTHEPPPAWPARPGRCAYQQGPRCMARDRRPLGCRAHFCNSRYIRTLQATYEQFHDLLRRLHDRLALPYRYVELTAGVSLCMPLTYTHSGVRQG